MSVASPLPLESSAPLSGERVAFTGTLASMTHREAAELVASRGGTATEHVSRQTTLLIIGEEGWPLEPDGLPSVKLQQAMKWQLQGQSLRILRESDWLSVLGLTEERDALSRLHTPAMLAQLLSVGVGTIRRWARLGLIQPVKTVYRLPYFSYADAAGVRRLAELVDAGVSVAEIRHSFETFRAFYPNIDRPLSQLELLWQHHHFGFRDRKGRLVTSTGQRLIDFETPSCSEGDDPHQGSGIEPTSGELPAIGTAGADESAAPSPTTSEEWHALAADLADRGDLEAAMSAVRAAVRLAPHRAELHAQLADLLYRSGHAEAAAERWSVAVELDPDDLEAWTQLGCVSIELHRYDISRVAFQEALRRHPDYADARYHFGELLHLLGEQAAAREQWEAYLRLDQRGPWADVVRARLGLDDHDSPEASELI